jgi:hypothetical protein
VPAIVTWQTRPALRTGEFHCAVAQARESGDLSRLLAVVEEYADVLLLHATQPPDGLSSKRVSLSMPRRRGAPLGIRAPAAAAEFDASS